tara:strand:+ start:4327 stop:4533 length:207 start_codon:yes stop_codon:yes gene_type:complete
MARPEGECANSENTEIYDNQDFAALFEELKNWEEQLRHIDQNLLADDENSDNEKSTNATSKRGGPSPC